MGKYLIFIVGIILTCGTAHADSNLIKNPGFDFKDWDQYWTESSPGATDVRKSASEYFSSPNSALFEDSNPKIERTATLFQNFAASSGLSYIAGAYIKSLSDGFSIRDGAYAYVGLGWYGHSGNNIGDMKLSDYLTGANNAWSWFSLNDVAPVGTTFGRIYLNLYSPGLTGHKRTAYFDNASVAVVPEPISTILFLTGGALVGGRLLLRRRKSKIVS